MIRRQFSLGHISELGITLVIPSNKEAGPEKLMTEIERAF